MIIAPVSVQLRFDDYTHRTLCTAINSLKQNKCISPLRSICILTDLSLTLRFTYTHCSSHHPQSTIAFITLTLRTHYPRTALTLPSRCAPTPLALLLHYCALPPHCAPATLALLCRALNLKCRRALNPNMVGVLFGQCKPRHQPPPPVIERPAVSKAAQRSEPPGDATLLSSYTMLASIRCTNSCLLLPLDLTCFLSLLLVSSFVYSVLWMLLFSVQRHWMHCQQPSNSVCIVGSTAALGVLLAVQQH